MANLPGQRELEFEGWSLHEERFVNGFHRVSFRHPGIKLGQAAAPVAKAAAIATMNGWDFITYSYIEPWWSILLERKAP